MQTALRNDGVAKSRAGRSGFSSRQWQ